jgi:hypothetical protein
MLRMRKMQRNNTSGFPGVTYDKARGLWRVRFTWRGMRKSYPRMFKDQQEAIETARALRARLMQKLNAERKKGAD